MSDQIDLPSSDDNPDCRVGGQGAASSVERPEWIGRDWLEVRRWAADSGQRVHCLMVCPPWPCLGQGPLRVIRLAEQPLRCWVGYQTYVRLKKVL